MNPEDRTVFKREATSKEDFEKALSRIKKNVLPQDEWEPEDYNHYHAIVSALEMCISRKSGSHEKTGNWIILESDECSALCKCSACEKWITIYGEGFLVKYCPECGAKMINW